MFVLKMQQNYWGSMSPRSNIGQNPDLNSCLDLRCNLMSKLEVAVCQLENAYKLGLVTLRVSMVRNGPDNK